MANHKHAKKCIRKTARQTLVNKSRMSRVRTFVKKFEGMVAGAQKPSKEEAISAFNDAQRELARAASKGLIHKNNASRKISRLARDLKNLAA